MLGKVVASVPRTGIGWKHWSATSVVPFLAGLLHLKSMSRLTKLNLTGTAVTDDGVKEAKEWLPFWAKITR